MFTDHKELPRNGQADLQPAVLWNSPGVYISGERAIDINVPFMKSLKIPTGADEI